jgi:hypothetical protein
MMNRRYVLGLLGALALAGVVGVRATAEKSKAAKDCCCADRGRCGDACQEACCCDPACRGDSCCCDSIADKAAAVEAESCCDEDVKAAGSSCPLSATKADCSAAR